MSDVTPQPPNEENTVPPTTSEQPVVDTPTPENMPPVYVAEPPDQRKRSGGGCGCWIPIILALLCAGALVGIGLFLPPINLYDRLFGEEYVMLDAVNNGAGVAGFAVIVNPDDVGEGFGLSFDSANAQAVAGASTSNTEWLVEAGNSIPPALNLISDMYHINTTGTEPESINVTLDVPASVTNLDMLDLYGYSGGQWQFIPSQFSEDRSTVISQIEDLPDSIALFEPSPLDPIVHTTVEIRQMMNEDVGQVASIVSPAGLTPNPQGALLGSLAPGFSTTANYRVMPIIRNFDDPRAIDTVSVPAILNNNEVRRAHIQQLTAIATNSGYDGVFIDYREIPIELRDNFSRFISELGEAFDNNGLMLGVVVPQAENVNGVWETGAYDWRVIGQATDYLTIAFEQNPTNFVVGEDRFVEAMLRWAVNEVERSKLFGGVTALSLRESDGAFTPIGYDEALSGVGDVIIEAETSETGSVEPGAEIVARLDGSEAVTGIDTTTQTPIVDYISDAGTITRMWLTTPESLRFRLDQFQRFGLGGATITDLVETERLASDVLSAVFDYQLGRPIEVRESDLALRWRVEDANGVIDEVTTGFNEELVVTLEAVEGNFAINVEIIDNGEIASVRSGAAVSVFAPTATPTPLPTATPTPSPTATPTLEPIVPTSAPAPGSGGNVDYGNTNTGSSTAPGAGSIISGFEYGGHVTSANSSVAINAMRSAGMTWMKEQVVYFPGKNPGDVAAIINAAHGNGFKILLGIVGNPNDLAAGGQSYINGYAQFLAGVASMGPDAIEVWNEPNIDREWPNGQISGANYTSMLSAAYQAIKGANGSVMVISAALAPTGAEAAFPGAVVNDDNFLSQMVQAGAMNVMDCVGVHYNEGIVSPRQQFGDPRDNYYSRYYQSMVDLYWGITGGQKPLCFTELGYLTSEGYGALGPYWAWAQNTTVQQQAAWLADVIALASQSGRIKLLIIWNIDFTRFDDNDPQGGFAIVRPGGGCPACQAIAGAR